MLRRLINEALISAFFAVFLQTSFSFRSREGVWGVGTVGRISRCWCWVLGFTDKLWDAVGPILA